MAKSKFTDEDNELLAALGVEVENKKPSSRSAREERIIAGFGEITQFFEQNSRLPTHGEERNIFERLYAVRLDKIQASAECRAVLSGADEHSLLASNLDTLETALDHIDDDALLAELGMEISPEQDITKLTHVKTRAEIRASEEIAQRIPCANFTAFKPLLTAVQEELKTGVRQSRRFKQDAQIKQGEFFILGGQIAYVAEMGEEFMAEYGRLDRRLRVIYDNGTESDILIRSLQRALYKDDAGRRITDPSAGPLFSDSVEEGDIESGTIYVLRSKSEHPHIKKNYNVIHKIGVTSIDIKKRIANANLTPLF